MERERERGGEGEREGEREREGRRLKTLHFQPSFMKRWRRK